MSDHDYSGTDYVQDPVDQRSKSAPGTLPGHQSSLPHPCMSNRF